MALTSSVTTKVDSGVMSRRIIQVLTGGTANVGAGDIVDLEMLTSGSAHLVLTSGTAPGGGIQYMVANDPLAAFVNLGAPLTTLPNMIPLTIGTIQAAGPGTLANVTAVAYRYAQFNVVSAAGGAFVVTITMELMGSRG
jgi:hypothetical protein